jgi:hypothetical protein
MMVIRVHADDWWPRQPGLGWRSTDGLTADTLVIWDRKPYRVVEVREVPTVDWPEKYREAWVQHGMPDAATWSSRPMIVVVRDEEQPGGEPVHLQWAAGKVWRTLPEHYAICRLCRELPPCTHEHNEKIMERAAERMQEQMAILPGSCHACREPITRRQRSFTFPGPNLIRPDLGDDSARFHMRDSCEPARMHYDEGWSKATGLRPFFSCTGRQVEHYDGTVECSESECPGKVRHASWEQHAPRRGMRGVAWSGCWCLAGVEQATIEDVA